MDIFNLIKNKLVKSSGIVLAAMIVSSLFMLLFRMLLAHSLSIAEYGLFFAINSSLILVGTFANFGLAEAYIKYFCQYKAEKNYPKLKGLIYMVFLTRALFALILTIACYFLSEFLITYFFKSDDGHLLFIILVVANMLTSATFNFLMVTYRSLNNMKMWGFLAAFNSFMLLAITAIGFLFWKNILVAAIASTAGSFIIVLIFLPIIKKEFHYLKGIKAEISFREWKKIFYFGIHLVLIAVCNFILTSTDTMMLTYLSTLTSVGMYQVAMPLARVFLNFTTAINIPLLPHLSSLYAQNKKKQFRHVFIEIHKLSVIFLLPVVIIGSFFCKYAIQIFFGKEYLPAASSAIVLLFSMFFMLIFNMNLNIFISMGRPKIGNVLTLIGAALNIILNYFFILRWDFLGASIATLISCAFMGISSFLVSYRISRTSSS